LDFDIEILHSVLAALRRTTEAPSRPPGRRAGSQDALGAPERPTLPVQSGPNASPFWIMLLLSSGPFEHGMIEATSPGFCRESVRTSFSPLLFLGIYEFAMDRVFCSQTLPSRSSVRLMTASRRTTEAPPRPLGRRGRISGRPRRPNDPHYRSNRGRTPVLSG
jgi:hypothetical protein